MSLITFGRVIGIIWNLFTSINPCYPHVNSFIPTQTSNHTYPPPFLAVNVCVCVSLCVCVCTCVWVCVRLTKTEIPVERRSCQKPRMRATLHRKLFVNLMLFWYGLHAALLSGYRIGWAWLEDGVAESGVVSDRNGDGDWRNQRKGSEFLQILSGISFALCIPCHASEPLPVPRLAFPSIPNPTTLPITLVTTWRDWPGNHISLPVWFLFYFENPSRPWHQELIKRNTVEDTN